MKIAIPDLVSNSYFPALAAVELGCFKEQGVAAEIALSSLEALFADLSLPTPTPTDLPAPVL